MLFLFNLVREYDGHIVSRRTLSGMVNVHDDFLVSVQITEGLEAEDSTITAVTTEEITLADPDDHVMVFVDIDSGRLFGPYDVDSTPITKIELEDETVVFGTTLKGIFCREFEDIFIGKFSDIFVSDLASQITVYDPYKSWASYTTANPADTYSWSDMVKSRLQGVFSLDEARSILRDLDLTLRPEATLAGFSGSGGELQYQVIIDSTFPRYSGSRPVVNSVSTGTVNEDTFQLTSVGRRPVSGSLTITADHFPERLYEPNIPDRYNSPGKAQTRRIYIGERQVRHSYAHAWHGFTRPALYLDTNGPNRPWTAVYIDAARWRLYNTCQTMTTQLQPYKDIIVPNQEIIFEKEPDLKWRVESVTYDYMSQGYNLATVQLSTSAGGYTAPVFQSIPAVTGITLVLNADKTEWTISWTQPVISPAYEMPFVDHWEVKITGSDSFTLYPQQGNGGTDKEVNNAFQVSITVAARRPDEDFDPEEPTMLKVNGAYQAQITPWGLYNSGSSAAAAVFAPTAVSLPAPGNTKAEPDSGDKNTATSFKVTWDKVPNAAAYIVELKGQGACAGQTIKVRTSKRDLTVGKNRAGESDPNKLTPGCVYTATVRAVDSNGVVSTTAQTFTIDAGEDPKPKPLAGLQSGTDSFDDTKDGYINTSNAAVSWTADPKAESYRVVVTDSSGKVVAQRTATDNAAFFNVGLRGGSGGELDPDSSYSYTVTPIGHGGIEGDTSSPMTITTNVRPKPPTGLSLTGSTVTWTPPAETGPNSAAGNYVYRIKVGESGAYREIPGSDLTRNSFDTGFTGQKITVQVLWIVDGVVRNRNEAEVGP